MTTYICVFCHEPCTVLVDGDFCEACFDGAIAREIESKV
jgi:hypothetical protein